MTGLLPAARWVALLTIGVLLAACAETQFVVHTAKRLGTPSPAAATSVGKYKVGNPYQIKGVWYHPSEDYAYDETGIASWYGTQFHGRSTANGEVFDMNGLSAAHRTLPMPSLVRVTNLENGRTLNLRVNDRGPFAHGRIIDLSRRAAQLLGFERQGTARVRVRILAGESRMLATRLQREASSDKWAATDTPIIVPRLPKPPVSQEALPPPAGAVVSPAPAESGSGGQVSVTPLTPPAAGGTPAGVVTVAAVRPTDIFVQAGAYASFENANKTRAMLSRVGQVKISSVLINGRDLFRVRVGPLTSVEEADRKLEMVIGAGYPDARVIVD